MKKQQSNNVCIQCNDIGQAQRLKEQLGEHLNTSEAGEFSNLPISIRAFDTVNSEVETRTLDELKEEFRDYLRSMAEDGNDVEMVEDWETWYAQESSRLEEEGVIVIP